MYSRYLIIENELTGRVLVAHAFKLIPALGRQRQVVQDQPVLQSARIGSKATEKPGLKKPKRKKKKTSSPKYAHLGDMNSLKTLYHQLTKSSGRL
ncbi:hypothetical protein I79_021031 [Cricetulus griseus]|uniref:Uncharacterized protein n=1 Tax=Cricetulus griseus TaxID=10029 RepID=G3IBK5_CRIGR|nr:hypothetical protein I79_021031 [Cricetulus griseus]